MRLLRNAFALTPCGKPQAAHFAHVTELLQWLPGRAHFTDLKQLRGGRSAYPCALVCAALPLRASGRGHLGVGASAGLGELLVVDASFVSKSGRGTWGTGWFRAGMARAVRWGLEVALLAAVDVGEGGC